MLTQMIYAALATLAITSNASPAPKLAVIVCDARRPATSSQIVDLHDVTGHHRYYGRSA